MTIAELDRDLQVHPLGDGRLAAELPAGWQVGGGVNGGFQLALVGAALRTELSEVRGLGTPDPLVLAATYLSAAVPGPAELHVRVRRSGGRTTVADVELRQGDAVRLAVLATCGDLAALSDDVRTTAPPLALPPREACVSNEHAPPQLRAVAPLMDRFEMLFPAEQAGCFVGAPTGRGELSAWFRLRDEREPDPLALLLAVDALPPVTFDLGSLGWAPTMQLTAHVRALPAPGWLRLVHRTRNIAGGMFEEDCEVWDAADRLVAQGRQLALLPR